MTQRQGSGTLDACVCFRSATRDHRQVVATLVSCGRSAAVWQERSCLHAQDRAGVSLPVIQVIERWGSMAVKRYVQDDIFVFDGTSRSSS